MGEVTLDGFKIMSALYAASLGILYISKYAENKRVVSYNIFSELINYTE